MPTRTQLLTSATSLCDAFASHASLETILSHFSTSHQVTAKEHGLPFLAPFLGRTFSSLDPSSPTSIPAYFGLLQELLVFENMSFGEWAVDTEANKVCCKGKARFRWVEEGSQGKEKQEWWDESFVYMLDFDFDAKVTDYQVWADSGAAYLARIGQLDEKRKEYEKESDV